MIFSHSINLYRDWLWKMTVEPEGGRKKKEVRNQDGRWKIEREADFSVSHS